MKSLRTLKQLAYLIWFEYRYNRPWIRQVTTGKRWWIV